MVDAGDEVSGRSYARAYRPVKRLRHHTFIKGAVARAGGRALFSTGGGSAPLFLGIEDATGERIGVCAYVFLANRRITKNRPEDEHRLQVRYGDVNSAAWREEHHPIGFDPMQVDVTVVLGAHLDADVIVGLDPLAYDPLPMGISVFFKQEEVNSARRAGWHVWERDNVSGAKRADIRTPIGIETLVAFTPERLLDFIRFERAAQSLGLDPALRFRAAEAASTFSGAPTLHALEVLYGLPANEILGIIAERHRLGVAVRGGVAERHLQTVLESDPEVATLELGTGDGPPDFIVHLRSGSTVAIECKNASPVTYADGTPKVETQKTRASKADPLSRLYSESQFDMVAACMFGLTGRWEFRFQHVSRLARDVRGCDRLAAVQRIDSTWAASFAEAIPKP